MVTVPKSGTLDTGSLSTASGLIAPVTKDREDVVYSDQYIDRQRKKDLERNNLPDLEFTDSQRRQMFLNMPDRDPTLQARLLEIEKMTGLPPPFLDRHQDIVKSIESDKEWFLRERGLQDTPFVREWLNNPEHAVVARDDVEALANAEKAWTMTSSYPQAPQGDAGSETDLGRLQRETLENALNRNVIPAEDREYSVAQEMFEDLKLRSQESLGFGMAAVGEEVANMTPDERLNMFAPASGNLGEQLLNNFTASINEWTPFWTPFNVSAGDVSSVKDFEDLMANDEQLLEAMTQLSDTGRNIALSAYIDLSANDPYDGNRGVIGGLAHDVGIALGEMILPAAATLILRKPMMGASMMGGYVYTHKYGESRMDGRTIEEARQDATAYALMEVLTERIPLGFLMKPGKKFLERTLGMMGLEGAQEMLTETFQMGYDIAVLDQNMTFGQAVERVLSAGLIGSLAGGGIATITHPIVSSMYDGQANAAVDQRKRMDAFKEFVDTANLSDISPDLMAEVGAGIMGDQTVYLDHDAIEAAFTGEDGVVDRKKYVEFLRAIGVPLNEAIEASFNGTPLEISAAAFNRAVVLGEQGIYEALADHVRIGETSPMTPAEAAEYLGASKEADALEGTAAEAQAAQEAEAAQEAQAAQETEEGSAGQDIVPVDDSGVTSPPVPEGAKESIRTDTPEFAERFGASEVTHDRNTLAEGGAPLRVYHGTSNSLEGDFNHDQHATMGGADMVKLNGVPAFYFSSSTKTASTFAPPTGGNVVPAYLRMENPADIETNGRYWSDYQGDIVQAYEDGFDGVILRDVRDGGGVRVDGTGPDGMGESDVYIVFSADQIIPEISNSNRVIDPNNDGFRASIRTDTPEFAEWFGESKAAKDGGAEPLQLFHLTPKDVGGLVPGGVDSEESGRAIWMTPDPDTNNANFRVSGRDERYREGVNTMPVYASIQNPLVLDSSDKIMEARAEYGSEFPQLISEENLAKLTEAGHDGVMLHSDGALDEVIALEADQVKSSVTETYPAEDDGFRASVPDKPRDSQDVPPPLWFSGLTRAFEQLAGTQTALPEQWINIIRGLNGVKKDEIETSQVLDFLFWHHPEAQITHERVLQYLSENEVVIEETILTDAGSLNSYDLSREDFVEVQPGVYDVALPADMHNAGLGTHVRVIMQKSSGTYPPVNPMFSLPPIDFEAVDLENIPDEREIDNNGVIKTFPMYVEILSHQGQGNQIHGDEKELFSFVNVRHLVADSVTTAAMMDVNPVKWAHRVEEDPSGVGHRLVTPGNVTGTNFELLIRAPKNISSARGIKFNDYHWTESGVVAHVRGNEHTSPDGVRTLVIDELQSDIHKKAREKNITMDEPPLRFPKRSDFIIERGDLTGWRGEDPDFHDDYINGVYDVDGAFIERWHVRKKGSNVEEIIASGDTENSAWMKATQVLRQEAAKLPNEPVNRQSSLQYLFTPNAPFKGNGWVNVLLRRMLRKAADEGFGRVSWTPGHLQAERYGKLFREVSHVTMDVMSSESGTAENPGYTIVVDIEIVNTNGNVVLSQPFKMDLGVDEDLDVDFVKQNLNAIGFPQHMAKDIVRIHEEHKGEWSGYLENIRYSPGNESGGMFGQEGFGAFYDTMVTSAMNKLVKRFGVEVKQTEIDTPQIGPEDSQMYVGQVRQYFGMSQPEWEQLSNTDRDNLHGQFLRERATERMWSVDLTDEMKEAFKSSQPMFSIRGMPTAEYVNNAEVVTAAMRKRLDAMSLEGVALKVEDIIRRDMDGVTVELEGYYWQGLVAIALEQNRDIMEVLNHEAIHALKDMGVFKDAEWNMLVTAAKADDAIMSKIRQKYGNRSQDIQDEEAVAEFFAKMASEQQQPEGFVADMLNRIRQFFLSIRDAFLEGGFSNIEDLYQAIDLGVVGRREMQAQEQKAVNAAIKMFMGVSRIAPNTAKFGRWFKQSDAVNSVGSPKILYHANKNDHTVFDPAYAEFGHHFGTLPQASDRAGFPSEVVDMIDSGKDIGKMNEERREGANILPAYISVQKPLITPDMNFWMSPTEWSRRLPKAMPDAGVTIRESKYALGEMWSAPNALEDTDGGSVTMAQDQYEVWIDVMDYLTNSDVISRENEAEGESSFGGGSILRTESYEDGSELSEVRGEFKRAMWGILNAHGFDSLKYRNTAEGQVLQDFEDNSPWSYAVQHSTQIKSAIANNGEYDSANPDIRYSIKDNEDGSKTYDAKPGIDPRMLTLLGPNLYGDMSKLPEVTVKEVFQNSFDAIKGLPSDSGSPSGNISIVADYDEATYYFGDTGTGMTPDILSKAFLTVAGSHKAGSRASGGFGIAKVAFLFNNLSIRLATLRDGKLTVMESSGAEIAEALVSGGRIPLNESDYSGDMESVSQKMFPLDEIGGRDFLALSEPLRGAMHGTVMSIKLPDEFENADGDIDAVDFHENVNRLPVMKHSMLLSPIGVYWNGEKLHIGEEISKTEIVPYSQINFAWGSATIYVGPPTESTYRYQSNLHYMSNGLWQFSDTLKENPNSFSSDPVPDHIYIDMRIKVEATDSRYPISLNRQELAFSAKKSIEQVLGYLAAQYMVRNFQKQSVSYGSAEYLDAYYETEAINLVPNVDFNPSETIVQKISSDDNVTVDDDGVIRVNGKEMPEITSEQIKAFRTAAEVDKLVLPKGSVSTTRPVAHDNTTLREFGGKGILEASRDEFGIDRVNDLMRFIVDSMFEARSIVIDAFNDEYGGPDYSKLDGLTDNVFGVSFDTKYMGVNTKVPMNAVFINPAVIAVSMTVYDSHNNSKRLAHAIVGTMLHEFAHEQVRSHDADFADFMGQVYDAFYRSEEGMSLVDEVERYFAQNLEILRWMRDKTRNAELIGSRLKDAGGDQQRSTDGLSGEQPERSGDAGGRDNVPRLVRQGDQDPEGQRDDDGVLPEDDGFRASIAGDESLPEDAPEDGDSSSGVTSHPDPDVELPIALAEFEMGLNGFFENAKEAGMTPKEYEAHLAKVASNAEATRKRREANVLKQEKRESTKWWKTEWQRIANELESTYRQEHPVYATIHAIENGDARMDRGKVLDNMGNPELMRTDLPRLSGNRTIYTGRDTEEEGMDPQIYAERFGMTTGELLGVMQDALSLKDQVAIDANMIMREKHGDILERNQAIDDALEIIAQDGTAEILADELNALRNAKKQKKVSAKVMKEAARQRIQEYKVKNLNPNRFLLTAKKQGQLARKLLRKGDRQGAAKAKFRQLLNFHMANLSYKAQTDASNWAKHMRKFQKRKGRFPNLEAGTVTLIRDRLQAFSMGNRMSEKARKEIENRRVLARAQGQDLPAGALREYEATNFRDLSLGQLHALYNEIKNIEALGRDLKKIRLAEKDEEIDTIIDELIDVLQANVPESKRTVALRGQQSAVQGAKYTLMQLDASVRKVEFLLQRLDGGAMTGAFHRVLFQPVADSQTRESDMSVKYIHTVMEAFKNLPPEIMSRMGERINVPSLHRKMTRGEILMLALNAGNTSNLDKVVQGNKSDIYHKGLPDWTEAGVRNAISLLSKEEGDWVQMVWDTLANIYPEVERIFEAQMGVLPEAIEPSNIEIGGEVRKGGYFPMMYNPDRMVPKSKTGPEAIDDAFSSDMRKSSIYSGMTLERSDNYSAPPLLSLSSLPRALHQSIHYVTHFESVQDVKKILHNNKLAEELIRRMGRPYYDELVGWIEAVATSASEPVHVQGLDQTMEFFRSSMVAGIMGASLTTGASQAFGNATSVAVLGRNDDGTFSNFQGQRWMYAGWKATMQNPAEAHEFAVNNSGEMRHRMGNIDRDMSDTLKHAGGETSKFMRWRAGWQRHSLSVIGYAQLWSVDVATWHGAYQKKFSEGDASHLEAVRYADSVIRMSQGSGAVKDLAGFARSRHPMMRTVTMFTTYTTVLYNIQAQIGSDTMKDPKRFYQQLFRMSWLTVIPAMADAFLRGEGPEDDDEWAEWFLWKLTAYSVNSVPIFGPMGSSVIEGFNPSMSPITQIPTSIARSLQHFGDLMSGEEDVSWKTAEAAMNAVGYTLGIGGTAQAARFFDALNALEENSNRDPLYIREFIAGHHDR